MMKPWLVQACQGSPSFGQAHALVFECSFFVLRLQESRSLELLQFVFSGAAAALLETWAWHTQGLNWHCLQQTTKWSQREAATEAAIWLWSPPSQGFLCRNEMGGLVKGVKALNLWCAVHKWSYNCQDIEASRAADLASFEDHSLPSLCSALPQWSREPGPLTLRSVIWGWCDERQWGAHHLAGAWSTLMPSCTCSRKLFATMLGFKVFFIHLISCVCQQLGLPKMTHQPFALHQPECLKCSFPES